MIWNQITSDLGPTMIGLLFQATTYPLISTRLGIQNLRIITLTHPFPTQPQNVTDSFPEDPVRSPSIAFLKMFDFFVGGERSVFFPSETQT